MQNGPDEHEPDAPGPDVDVDATPAARALRSAGEWLRWFGLGRVLVAALSVLAVAAGAYWLLRAPTAPVEGSLPWSSAVGSTTSAAATSPDASVQPQPTSTALSAVAVHVAGAVARPGVYELEPGSRVDAAIAAAGGVLADADVDTLNLAAPLADGSRLFVPLVGQEVPPTVAPAPPASDGTRTPAAIEPIDINRADRVTLDELPGVGPATADAIVTDRELNGPFVSVDDLERVSGIGPATLDRLRDLVRT